GAWGYRPGYWGGYYAPSVGFYWGAPYWGWGATWGWPYYGYAYPYAYAYPYTVPSTAWSLPEYVEQPNVLAAPAPADAWFYCTDPAGYYPYVTACNRPWMSVAPSDMQGGAARPAQ
ncbi:MAG TPA: hypothetical protein VF196_03585, partial [Casimicrobiaceae bacterium]